MKLVYFRAVTGKSNFGDELNLHVFKKLLPEINTKAKLSALVGFGTLVNDKLPGRIGNAKKVAIFSTGAGYGTSNLSIIPKNWHIYCLRGPLTAKILGLNDKYAITDGAILSVKLFKRKFKIKYDFSIMPHGSSLDNDWKKLCSDLGIHLINPHDDVIKVITEIKKTRFILAEAMHGAIVADAFRIPWLPIVTSKQINLFKWRDYCCSIKKTYSPVNITVPKKGILSSLSKWSEIKSRIRLKKNMNNSKNFILSDDFVYENLLSRLEDKLYLLRKHIGEGKFD